MKIIRNVAPTNQHDDKISIVGLSETEYHVILQALQHVFYHAANLEDGTYEDKKAEEILACHRDFDSAKTRIIHI